MDVLPTVITTIIHAYAQESRLIKHDDEHWEHTSLYSHGNGIEIHYDDHNMIRSLFFNYSDRRNGPCNYYQGDYISNECYYRNGCREGTDKHYYHDGVLFETANYLHDMKKGPCMSYDRDGTIYDLMIHHDNDDYYVYYRKE